MTSENTSDDSFAFVLATAARLMRTRFEAALRKADLEITPAEARTLTVADRLGHPRQAELASAMGIEPMSLVNHLDRLEKRGLIERIADPIDRRIKLIGLTEKAKPELRKIRCVFDQARELAMRNFSSAERTQLHLFLQRLSHDLLSNE
ncbi:MULTISPECIES: MarR family transcriptional regulator [unclassified Paraburkholderia]|uniref:MarR family winged helix-turn-helix transcriptional regulator n=1 Tax=unclassified Paraburkholderia TaxID=2615204 RepID=UPI002AB2E60C|nr:MULTISPECIES: MarR family transcriptional regulator [unclassified Paraburkholderia]